MNPILKTVANILPAQSKMPMCRINRTSDKSDREDTDWTSTLQRFRSLETVTETKGWLRFSANYETFASEQVIKRHKKLLETSPVYRTLDIVSHLFGAYDSRIPQPHRGGMIKLIKWTTAGSE